MVVLSVASSQRRRFDAAEALRRLRGGATAFYAGQYGDPDVEESQVLRFEPRRGTALLHGHGERCLLHEGCEVTGGIKYLLRTDVMYA